MDYKGSLMRGDQTQITTVAHRDIGHWRLLVHDYVRKTMSRGFHTTSMVYQRWWYVLLAKTLPYNGLFDYLNALM